MAVRVLCVLAVLLFRPTLGGLSFPECCVVPATVHVLQNDTCQSLRNIASDKVVWFAMRGEQESKQLLLDLGAWPVQQPTSFTLTPSPLHSTASTIPASTVSWLQVGYVYCNHTTRYADSGGGWRPDPLLPPLEDGSIMLQSGVTQPIWLTIAVPYDTQPGTYSGQFNLSIMVQGVGSVSHLLDVELTVWNINLPALKDSKFPAIFSFNPSNLDVVYGSDAPKVKQKFYDLFLSQRVGGDNLYTTVPTDLPTAESLAEAGVQWLSLYDVYGVSGIGNEARVGGACLNFTDDLVKKVMDILSPVVSEYEAKGILGNMFVYGFDETPESCEPSIRKIYTAIKSKWPQLRTAAVLNWLPPLDLPLDAWILQYEFFDQSEAAKWTAAGKEQWWYHCIEPSGTTFLNSFIERPLLETRLLFWLGASYDVAGWLYYSILMWHRYPQSSAPLHRINGTAQTDFSPANYIWYPRTDIFANGDGNFVYPGPDGPIASARLHNLRDGFEDAELFRMLELSKVAEFTRPLVRSPTNYTLDPILFKKQRLMAATQVQAGRKMREEE